MNLIHAGRQGNVPSAPPMGSVAAAAHGRDSIVSQGFAGKPARRQMQQPLANLSLAVPAAPVPLEPAHVVAAVQDLPERHAPKAGHRAQGRAFHFHRQTALGAAAGDLAGRFPIQPVRGPGLPRQVSNPRLVQHGPNGGYRCRRRRQLPRRRKVVIRGPLVAHGGRRHDQVADHDVTTQHAGRRRRR